MAWLAKGLTDAAKNAAVGRLEGIAAELGVHASAQLAIAWAREEPARRRRVITGASNVGQLRTNLGAVDVVPRLTPEVMARIDAIALPLAA